MKKTFAGYYPLSAEEKQKLLQNSLVCFDTNVLLNLYRYTKATQSAWTEALELLEGEDQTWLPYQAAYEYQVRRMDVIRQARESFDDTIQSLDKAQQ